MKNDTSNSVLEIYKLLAVINKVNCPERSYVTRLNLLPIYGRLHQSDERDHYEYHIS